MSDFPGSSEDKASAYSVGNTSSIPQSGRSPGEGNGNPLRYSCLPHPPKKRGLKEIFGFPGGSDGKASAYNARDLVSTPGSGKSPGEGNGDPLQYSCLENPMDGGA